MENFLCKSFSMVSKTYFVFINSTRLHLLNYFQLVNYTSICWQFCWIVIMKISSEWQKTFWEEILSLIFLFLPLLVTQVFSIEKQIASFQNAFNMNRWSHFSKEKKYNFIIFNPFPNKPRFSRVCNYSLWKTPREKEKLLVRSNFSFSHSVFYPFGELSAIFIKLKIVVCKLFQFRRVQILSYGNKLRRCFFKLPILISMKNEKKKLNW